jgi:hypothetical protein
MKIDAAAKAKSGPKATRATLGKESGQYVALDVCGMKNEGSRVKSNM